jgi:TolA-binding protein
VPAIPPTEDGVATTGPTRGSSPSALARDNPLPAPTPSESSAPPGLADEVSMLEVARRALREREPTRAEQELDHYATAFPSGILKPESIALRIEAKLARGERTEAAALGRRFLEVYPKHTLAPRMRALLGR